MRADQKLTPDVRREMILRGLSGENKTYLAHQYGITRRRLYTLLEEAGAITEADVNDASKELEFRRRVWEINESER